MYRARVAQPSSQKIKGGGRFKAPALVLAGSAIGAAVSLAGLIWTYLKPASFASGLGASGDSSPFGWIPHFPLIAALAILAIAGRTIIAATMHHGRRPGGYWLAHVIDIGVKDIPFIVAFFAIGLFYLAPMISHFVSQEAPWALKVGCAISRFWFSILAVSHLGHAAIAGWGLWLRRTMP